MFLFTDKRFWHTFEFATDVHNRFVILVIRFWTISQVMAKSYHTDSGKTLFVTITAIGHSVN